MIVSLSIFVVSVLGASLMIVGKSLSLRGVRLPLISRYTAKTDIVFVQLGNQVRDKANQIRHSALLKFHDIVYDSFIPWTQRRYRGLASITYRLHRKIWSTLEYSKQSSHKVSTYLRKLGSEEKNHEVNGEGVTGMSNKMEESR
jgi:hypothetical protein